MNKSIDEESIYIKESARQEAKLAARILAEIRRERVQESELSQ